MKRALALAGTVALAFGLLVGPALAQTPYVAGLTIEKEVLEEEEGVAPEDVEFEFSLDCGLDGDPQSFALGDGDVQSFFDLPHNTVCTLTEEVPDDLDAEDFITVFFVTPEALFIAEDEDARSVTFSIPEDDDDAAVFVDVVNAFGDVDVEEIVVERVVEVEEEVEVEDEVAVLAATGFEVTWGLLLGAGLLLTGGGAVLYARKREVAKA